MTWTFLPVTVAVAASLASLGWCFWLARRLRRINQLHLLDPLTGLRSGRCLELDRWPRALRSGRPLAVAYIDLDGLKARNDALGHDEGDRYIRTAAHALWSSFPITDEVFRLYSAGDEFLALLHGELDPERLAQDLPRRLRRFGVAASMGLAYCPAVRDPEARAALWSAAERACRLAKSQGGARVVVAAGQRSAAQPCRRQTPDAVSGRDTSFSEIDPSTQPEGRVLEPIVDSATAVLAPQRLASLAAQTVDSLGPPR